MIEPVHGANHHVGPYPVLYSEKKSTATSKGSTFGYHPSVDVFLDSLLRTLPKKWLEEKPGNRLHP